MIKADIKICPLHDTTGKESRIYIEMLFTSLIGNTGATNMPLFLPISISRESYQSALSAIDSKCGPS